MGRRARGSQTRAVIKDVSHSPTGSRAERDPLFEASVALRRLDGGDHEPAERLVREWTDSQVRITSNPGSALRYRWLISTTLLPAWPSHIGHRESWRAWRPAEEEVRQQNKRRFEARLIEPIILVDSIELLVRAATLPGLSRDKRGHSWPRPCQMFVAMSPDTSPRATLGEIPGPCGTSLAGHEHYSTCIPSLSLSRTPTLNARSRPGRWAPAVVSPFTTSRWCPSPRSRDRPPCPRVPSATHRAARRIRSHGGGSVRRLGRCRRARRPAHDTCGCRSAPWPRPVLGSGWRGPGVRSPQTPHRLLDRLWARDGLAHDRGRAPAGPHGRAVC